MSNDFMTCSDVSFADFIDGDCVNLADCILDDCTLRLRVRVYARHGCKVYVNSVAAVEISNGEYIAGIPVFENENRILAENKSDKTSACITVFRLTEKSEGSFRISSDDNILFLADLNAKKYSSIFENPYLSVYKKAHDLYGAKVQLNLFYSFEGEAKEKFSENRPYFDLSMMTDRYKEEFQKNSDWLKLAFHSRSEYPPRPYGNASAETITNDCSLIFREITRFAGAECISNSATVHYGSANFECVCALRSLGLRSLMGYFRLNEEGKPRVAYYASEKLTRHIGKRDFWVDRESNMTFGVIDSVLNEGTLDDVKKSISEVLSVPERSGFISAMIHEQYFYSDYARYLPDFEERVLWTCKYLFDKGYRGAHISEVTEL